MVKAEIEVDGQHGHIVRVVVGGISVAVYLLDETAVVTADQGQYGLEVAGPWCEFKSTIGDLSIWREE